MPIKGLTDIRRFSRGGKIRIGEKRESNSGKEYPAKLDYFKFDPSDKDSLAALLAHYGDKPRRLSVAFPSPDPEAVFPQYYKCYGFTGLQCKGDGETAMRVADGGALVEVDCHGPDLCEYSMSKGKNNKPGCKRIGTLQFFLVDWNQLFVWQIDTSSFNSIVNINTNLELLQRIAGTIAFVPIDLVIKPQTAQADGKKVIIYTLDLVVPMGLKQIRALRPLVAPAALASLPAPSDDTPDDLYPASQIFEPAPVVDEDGVVQEDTTLDTESDIDVTATVSEPEKVPEPTRRSTRKPRQEPAVAPEPRGSSVLDDLDTPADTETAGVDFSNLPEVQALMEQRPALARAILGQAKGENWTADQVLAMVRLKLRKEAQ